MSELAIELKQIHNPENPEQPNYEVVKTVNSIDYWIGQHLDHAAVRKLCGDKTWRVSIT